jgi:acyl-CoA synthetase (NDP forming)
MATALEANGQEELLDHGFVVQEMLADGVEMVVGVSHDSMFGPVVMVGLGGTLVELLADVSMRLHPLTDHDIDDMLIGLRGYPLLTGYRGSPPLDVLALKNVLVRVSALVETVPEIRELDLNPLFVRMSGVAAVDARIRVSRHASAVRG